MKASEWFKTRPVNRINGENNPDGTKTITIKKRGWNRAYKFTVRNYAKKNEKVVKDEEVEEEE